MPHRTHRHALDPLTHQNPAKHEVNGKQPAFELTLNANQLGDDDRSAENTLSAFKTFHDWNAAWNRAVALAWSDSTLKQQLLTDPHGFFKHHCNFTVPGTLVITVIEDTDARYTPSQVKAKWQINATRMIIFLPREPPLKEQAVALADYETIGLTYPFTFCC